jgi:hypothetical protein
VLLASFILALLAAHPAQPNAQRSPTALAPIFADPSLLTAVGELEPVPGAWAEYLVQSKKTKAVRVRISVLTEPAPPGRYWLELDTATPGAPPQAARLLVHGNPSRAENIERMEIYMLGQAPIEIPIDQLAGSWPEAGKAKAPAKIVHRAAGQVSVQAGRFTTEIVDVGDTRVWRSRLVPLWGLVKGRSPRETVELLGSGRDGAHSVFPRVEPAEK